MEWNFLAVLRDFDLLLLGLVNTLKITGLALLFGIPIGLGLALARLSTMKILSGIEIKALQTTMQKEFRKFALN